MFKKFKGLNIMNKNKTLLLIALSTLFAITGTVFIANKEVDNLNTFALNRSSPSSDYVLTLDSSNRITNNYVSTSLGNKVYFATEGNVKKTPLSGWVGFEGDIASIYNTSSISGMKSIDFIIDAEYVDLSFGYMEDSIIHYSNCYNMTGKDDDEDGQYTFHYDFLETPPSFFKIAVSSTCILDNITINYSCNEYDFVPTELKSFEFTYLSEEDAYRINGFALKRRQVQTLVVPNSYNGKPVVEIKSNAFFTNDKIRYVIISEGIKRIGDMAFYLDINLESIVLPSTIESTGDNIYDGCLLLTSQTISSSMLEVNPLTYAGNQFLETITVEAGNPNYYSSNGMLYAYSYNGYENALLVCPAGKTGDIVIPNNCEYIDTYAFKNSRASTITISSSVELIEESFKSCSYLTSFVVDSNNDYYSAQSYMLCDKLGGHVKAYPRGRSDTTLNMPSSIGYVEDHVFDKVSNLRTIRLMNTTHIGEGAFMNMPDLETVYLTNVTEIGNGAFKNCRSLLSVTFSSVLRVVTTEAFMGCSSLTSVTFPSTLTTINNRAFRDCSSLSSIVFDAQSQIKRIEGEAFMNCTSLDVDELPSSIEYIGTYVFRNTAIDEFFLPQSFTYIPDGMFMDCDNLTSVEIPSYVRTIGYDAFNDCENLVNVTIPYNSVETIHSKAFKGAGFSRVYLPRCIVTIEASAFACNVDSLDIYSHVICEESPSYSSSSMGGGGWLRDDWSEHLGGGILFHIYYNYSIEDYNALQN